MADKSTPIIMGSFFFFFKCDEIVKEVVQNELYRLVQTLERHFGGFIRPPGSLFSIC